MRIGSKNMLIGIVIGALIGFGLSLSTGNLDIGLMAGFFVAVAFMLGKAKANEKKNNK